MALESRTSPTPEADRCLVRVREVFKIYREGDAETVALRGANLDLRAGEFASLVGPSGSGKSTLISLLAGIMLPSAGQIIFDNRDITRLTQTERATLRGKRLGLVFQSANLIPFLTALENVKLASGLAGRRDGNSRARELLAELGLLGRLHHLPRQLSGGEAQRVSIAVALANEPDLVLGDELTGELDSATSEQIMQLLSDASRQRSLSLLLVTHNPELAARADRRLRLVDGLVTQS
jgi:ABC-type lipoprotein export system ATPase subunit